VVGESVNGWVQGAYLYGLPRIDVIQLINNTSTLSYDGSGSVLTTLGMRVMHHSLRVARKPLDPIRWHRYLYANADPVNMLDPRGRDAGETAGADAESIKLTEETTEEIETAAFENKFTDIEDAQDQLESLEDDLSYCDEGYCASSKKSLDALINIAKTLKYLP
jgi:hypothetical protein